MGARRRGCSSRLAHQTEEGARRCMHAQTHTDWFQPCSSHARRHPAHRRATGELRGLRRVRRLPDAGHCAGLFWVCACASPRLFSPFPSQIQAGERCVYLQICCEHDVEHYYLSLAVSRFSGPPFLCFCCALLWCFLAVAGGGMGMGMGTMHTMRTTRTSYRQTRTRVDGGCTMAQYAARSRQRFRARARAHTHTDYRLRATSARPAHNAQCTLLVV